MFSEILVRTSSARNLLRLTLSVTSLLDQPFFHILVFDSILCKALTNRMHNDSTLGLDRILILSVKGITSLSKLP